MNESADDVPVEVVRTKSSKVASRSLNGLEKPPKKPSAARLDQRSAQPSTISIKNDGEDDQEDQEPVLRTTQSRKGTQTAAKFSFKRLFTPQHSQHSAVFRDEDDGDDNQGPVQRLYRSSQEPLAPARSSSQFSQHLAISTSKCRKPIQQKVLMGKGRDTPSYNETYSQTLVTPISEESSEEDQILESSRRNKRKRGNVSPSIRTAEPLPSSSSVDSDDKPLKPTHKKRNVIEVSSSAEIATPAEDSRSTDSDTPLITHARREKDMRFSQASATESYTGTKSTTHVQLYDIDTDDEPLASQERKMKVQKGKSKVGGRIN